MSFRNNRKRSSSINTSILLTRRSSINPKDIEYIQNTLQVRYLNNNKKFE